MVDISYVKKITSNEVEKWGKIRCSLFVIFVVIENLKKQLNLKKMEKIYI